MFTYWSKLLSVTLVLVVVCGTSPLHADLSPTAQKTLDAAYETHKQSTTAAREQLLKAFDKLEAKLRKASGGDAAAQAAALEALQEERKLFENSQHIPFSPVTRKDAVTYLGKLQKSQSRLMETLEKTIKQAQSSGDDDLAKKLLAEKKSVPHIVGSWECQFTHGNGSIVKWRWNFFSDGTANPHAPDFAARPDFWSFQPNGTVLVINNVPEAPKGGWKDVWTVYSDGRRIDGRNQHGGKHSGVRVD